MLPVTGGECLMLLWQAAAGERNASHMGAVSMGLSLNENCGRQGWTSVPAAMSARAETQW